MFSRRSTDHACSVTLSFNNFKICSSCHLFHSEVLKLKIIVLSNDYPLSCIRVFLDRLFCPLAISTPLRIMLLIFIFLLPDPTHFRSEFKLPNYALPPFHNFLYALFSNLDDCCPVSFLSRTEFPCYWHSANNKDLSALQYKYRLVNNQIKPKSSTICKI